MLYTGSLIIAPIIVGMNFVSEALAEQISMEHFLGEYQGVSVEDSSKTWSPADLNVSIRPHDDGFLMEWTTVTKGDSGKIERQENSVKFHPTKRHNVYAAAVRPDLFGGWVPLDPFEGDPFMWARVLDSTLTHGIELSDDGNILFVSSKGDDLLIAIDLTNDEVRRISLSPAPYHVTAIQGSGRLYVSSRAIEKIWVIDQQTLESVNEITLNGIGHQMVVSMR